jgi:hypothetical protein
MNPYSPPEARVADPPPKPASAVKAVLLGFFVDVGGSIVSSLVLTIGYAFVLASQGRSQAEIQDTLQTGSDSGAGFALAAVVGCACSVLGGYVCARVSRRADYRLGAVLAALSVTAGLLLGGGGYSAAGNVLMGAVTFACVLLGTHYGARRNAH